MRIHTESSKEARSRVGQGGGVGGLGGGGRKCNTATIKWRALPVSLTTETSSAWCTTHVALRNRELGFDSLHEKKKKKKTSRRPLKGTAARRCFTYQPERAWKLNTFDVLSSSYPDPLGAGTQCDIKFSDRTGRFACSKVNVKIRSWVPPTHAFLLCFCQARGMFTAGVTGYWIY